VDSAKPGNDTGFHRHLGEDFRTFIRAGEFAPGGQVLREREIAEKFETGCADGEKPLWHEATLDQAAEDEFLARISGLMVSQSAEGLIEC